MLSKLYNSLHLQNLQSITIYLQIENYIYIQLLKIKRLIALLLMLVTTTKYRGSSGVLSKLYNSLHSQNLGSITIQSQIKSNT